MSDDAELGDDPEIYDIGPPPSPSDEQLWRGRAKAYDSQYKGPVHWRVVLNTIAATGSVASALREAGVTRHWYNRRRERYPEFAKDVQNALEYFREHTLERTAVVRAVDGWLEPVYFKGAIVGYNRKFSDALLTKLLEANAPDKFRSKTENTPGVTKFVFEGGLPDPNAEKEDESDIPIVGGPVPIGG